MTIDMLVTIGALLLLLFGVVALRAPIDITMVSILALLMLAGVVEPAQAFAGFSNPAVLMIAALYVVAQGMRETGAIDRLASIVLGRPKSTRAAIFRITTPVAGLSGFMNNTPLVAMFMPVVVDLGRRIQTSPSKLLMPLSFASILGGQLTLVGTASNLVVNGLYEDWLQMEAATLAITNATLPSAWILNGATSFFAPSSYGILAIILGIGFMILAAPRLLSERVPTKSANSELTGYEVRMRVEKNGPIIGKTIEQAGLRNLPGLYLSSIERENRVIAAVGPDEVLQAEDMLGFVGDVDGVRELQRIVGLTSEDDQPTKVDAPVTIRRLIEAVVSPGAPFVGQTVRQSRFRSVHNAAIIAVRRHGEKLQGRIGDIVLRPGDVLLLETSAGFVETHGGSPSFHLVSTVQGFQPVRHNRSWLATTLLFLMVIGLASGFLSPVLTVWIAALAMVTFRCTSTSSARRSIDFSVLVTIGAAIGIGSAISNSGLGSLVGEGLVESARSLGGGPHLAMAAIVLAAIIISQLATNYGGAVIVFPIAMSTALAFGANPVPFMLAVMAGAGSNFLTPIAYQTNLMVYGPGRYRFTDYARLGLGLQLIVLLTAIFLIPVFFPF